MRFAQWTFIIAGVYGLLVTLPLFFQETAFGRDYPPPITHPEFFYGFAGVTLAWQVAFLVIGRDPLRFRPMMLPAILEKATGLALIALAVQGRAPTVFMGAGMIDVFLGVLFVVAYVLTRGHR
jgi:hypothetical protein